MAAGQGRERDPGPFHVALTFLRMFQVIPQISGNLLAHLKGLK